MLTAGTIYKILHFFHFTVDIRNVCVLVAPLFSGFTALVTYFLTCEIWDDKAGLFAAVLIAIAPGIFSYSFIFLLSFFSLHFFLIYFIS